MKTILFTLTALALLWSAKPSPAYENFAWLTNWETSATFPGDIIRWHAPDTVWGPVHSNDWIFFWRADGQLPVFYDRVSTTKPRFGAGSSDSSAEFLGGPPIFNAPTVNMPETLRDIYAAAESLNTVMRVEGHKWFADIRGESLVCYYFPEGLQVDTTIDPFVMLDIASSPYVFFDGKVDIKGALGPDSLTLVVAASDDIRIMDNVMVEGTDTLTGIIPQNATSRICLASERWIIIGNSWENGRENRTLGADVIITALVFAMRGSFQFEQMNDVNDSYYCPVPPALDERGYIIVNGGIAQWRRGYIHRSNHGGTGYRLKLRYDERIRHWNPGVFRMGEVVGDEFTPVSDPLFPAQFTLAVSPNPFNASTTIRFTLPQASNVRAIVYDVLGREVAKLADVSFSAGSHQLSWAAAEQATGIYFLRFETLGQIETKKLMLIK